MSQSESSSGASSRRSSRARSNSFHIVANGSRGGWEVVKQDAARSSGHFTTQADAINAARAIARRSGGAEIVIHGNDGKIRDVVSQAEASAAARARLVADEKLGIKPDGKLVEMARGSQQSGRRSADTGARTRMWRMSS
ncbi:DUF2188 domain-containing protein [Microbacterium sp. K24]|uniref:DUF2188 domain-containing protein n=1 Tax=Microbacterium sp. K24 TaxID=2305446 RepID=UPI00109D4BAA|nr:DUF2188 domain-containing protein [Microbacterium sp. K24]